MDYDFEFKITIAGDVDRYMFLVKSIVELSLKKTHNIQDFTKNIGDEINSLYINTTYGTIRFILTDVDILELYSGWYSTYTTSRGIIIVYPVKSDKVKKPSWGFITENRLRSNLDKKVPIVIFKDLDGQENSSKELPYFYISGLSYEVFGSVNKTIGKSANLDKPFLILTRKLTGKEDLEFLEGMDIKPVKRD